jgi:hypothetical protein
MGDWLLVWDLDFTKVKPYWQNCSGFFSGLVGDVLLDLSIVIGGENSTFEVENKHNFFNNVFT